MDAMAEGGTLTVSASRSMDTARIGIADSGPGLTEEEASRLFTPYFTTRQHGTGLGLAFVQSIIADHRGRIFVERPDNGGARFVVVLPLANLLLAAESKT